MTDKIQKNYGSWIVALKDRYRRSQIKASVQVNREMIRFYWELGKDIAEMQLDAAWGSGFFERLSRDMQQEFPDAQGFSPYNLRRTKQFYLFYNQLDKIWAQVVPKLEEMLFSIPWGHHIFIMQKCKNPDEALYYVRETIAHNWSRAVLMNVHDTAPHLAQGKALTNFERLLPEPLSDLARETLKDPYVFNFLSLTGDYTEKELEDGLLEHVSNFLLSLGSGFAYMGRQVRIDVGGDEFFIDLLFYHVEINSYVVIELKNTKFKPEYLGQLGFYVQAIDKLKRKEKDNPTIGLLICKSKNNIVVEWSLNTTHQPVGVSEYKFSQAVEEEILKKLPSIQTIENELMKE